MLYNHVRSRSSDSTTPPPPPPPPPHFGEKIVFYFLTQIVPSEWFEPFKILDLHLLPMPTCTHALAKSSFFMQPPSWPEPSCIV